MQSLIQHHTTLVELTTTLVELTTTQVELTTTIVVQNHITNAVLIKVVHSTTLVEFTTTIVVQIPAIMVHTSTLVVDVSLKPIRIFTKADLYRRIFPSIGVSSGRVCDQWDYRV